jgi:hypothetical protein
MKKALTIIVVLAMVSLPALAGVRNVNLVSTGAQGVAGSATVLSGEIGGMNPYFNVEFDASMSSPPPANMVYEAWLVDTQGNTNRYIGAFQGGMLNTREQFAHWAEPWDSLAVSLEPAHNQNLTPTTIVSQGNFPGSDVSASNFMTMAVLPQDESFQRQLVMQRYSLTSDQVTSLRMQGCSYPQIALMANAATKCNNTAADISSMLMKGQSWDQIASSCNTTVASLLTPSPMVAVAGMRQEITPTVSSLPLRYLSYPNGGPVISIQQWEMLNKQGFSWRDVAVAGNIAAQTGETPENLLRMVRIQGQTWRDIAIDRGLRPVSMMDVSQWPFTQATKPMSRTELQMERQRFGLAPMMSQPTMPPASPEAPLP